MTRFTVPGPVLATAATWATRLNPSRPTAPPLAGVVLEAEGEKLIISASDFDTAGTATVDAEVAEPGRVLVAGRLLAAVTKTLGARDTATLSVEDTVLRLDIGKGQGWELPTLDLDLYPQLPAQPPGIAEVDAAELANALARVLPTIGTDPTIAALNGGYLVAGPGEGLTLVGTDRYRLAVAELDYEPLGEAAERGKIEQLLIPRELLEHVAATARESGPRVRLLAGPSTFGVAGDARTVIGRQLDANHLRWQTIALTEDTADAAVTRVDLDELRGAVARASVVLGEGESLTLRLSAEGISVKPTIGGKGRAEHTAEVISHDGDAQTAGVSAKYLRTAIESLGSPTAELRFMAKRWAPFLLQPVGADGEVVPGYRHVVAQQRQAVVSEAA